MSSDSLPFSSFRLFVGWCLFIVMILAGFIALDLKKNNEQMALLLEESAKEMAERVSKSISPTVWEVFQKSSNRQYSEELAANILDSELAANFVVGIHVYANFGSLLMGREKQTDGTIQSLTQLNTTTEITNFTGKVRLPIRSGSMTIGHIEVFYTDAYQLHRLQQRNLQTVLIYSAFASLLIALSYFLMKSFNAKRELQQSLSQLRQTQDQLIHSEKMASLGNLVAGLAHELNTPLGIAITSSSLVVQLTQDTQKKLSDSTLNRSALEHYFSQIIDSASIAEKGLNRAAELVTNFKLVSVDHHVEEVRRINLLDYVEEVISTLSIELKRAHCEVIIKGARFAFIETVPGAIAQVITNIVNNALVHAFDGRENKQLSIAVNLKENAKILLEIADNGCGMAPAVLKQIYEPFFTTKRGSGGTGLGMNIVFNLVNTKLHGTLTITSEQGRGTQIQILLPSTL